VCLDTTGKITISDRNNGRVRQVDLGGIISTLFGSGLGLNNPHGIALDTGGNLYIADIDNHRILLVHPSGVVTTAAGIGWKGYSGDGGPAISATLDNPCGVAVDTSENMYIADTENHCIRKVDTLGIITTMAGIGDHGGYSGDGGSATSAKLDKPQGVMVDASGNIYIADTDNHCIRKVDTLGIITTVAGTGSGGYSGDGGPATSAKLNHPRRVFVDSGGNIFIADSDNHRIRVVSTHDGTITTLAGTGSGGFNGNDQPAVNAKLKKPSSVAMAATRGGRKIYISDTENNRIRVLAFNLAREL
jgi:hypothetical protein